VDDEKQEGKLTKVWAGRTSVWVCDLRLIVYIQDAALISVYSDPQHCQEVKALKHYERVLLTVRVLSISSERALDLILIWVIRVNLSMHIPHDFRFYVDICFAHSHVFLSLSFTHVHTHTHTHTHTHARSLFSLSLPLCRLTRAWSSRSPNGVETSARPTKRPWR
jgi:hypothetical protein